MSLYQDHVESCSYEDLHHLGGIHRLLPENEAESKYKMN